jgi:hypothetical protein
MIHWRKKVFETPPAKLQTLNCFKQIAKAVKEKDGEKYTTTYYQDDEVLNALRAYSIDKDTFNEEIDEAKCYYCESFSEVVATLQVEHYRPKAKICDENNLEIEGTCGYYWLGCEWSNLLLACPKCNGSGAKGNKFPIKGTRRIEENPINYAEDTPIYDRSNCYADISPLKDEDPLLLNPEVDEIVSRFRFSKDGEIEGVDDKGKMSVRIYTLDRHQLNIARFKVKQNFMNNINTIIEGLEENILEPAAAEKMLVKYCKTIIHANQANNAYTLWARYFNQNFEMCFVSEVPEKYKELLRRAYLLATR